MTRILLVEDTPSDADLLRNALQAHSAWAVRTAVTCQEANRLLRDWQPDLIISDIHLPDGNGLEWIAEARRGGYEGPILVITGVENSTENVIAAIKAGADDYLLKETETYAALAATVERTLTRRRTIAARRQPLHALYAISNPLEAKRCRTRLRQQAPHIRLTFVHTLASLRQSLQSGKSFDAVVIDGDLPAANLLTIVRQFSPDRYPSLVWLAADPNPSPELARVLLTTGLAAYLPRNSDDYYTLLPIMLENAITAVRLRQAQANWTLSEARYSRLVENLPDIVYRYELLPQPRLTYLSPAIHRLTGHTPQALMQSPNALCRLIHPDDREAFRARLHEVAPSATVRWLTSEGRVVWAEHRHMAIYGDDGQLIAVEGIARDITETRRVRQNLQRRVKELELSSEVSRIVIESRDVDALCDRIAAAIAETFYSEHFGIIFLEEDGEHFRAHPASRGVPPEVLEKSFPVTRGVVGRCLNERRTIKVDDVSRVQDYLKVTPGMRSELCVPIQSGERLWGAINIEKPQPNAFTENDIRLATLVAEHLALGLDKISLLREEQRRRAEADALRTAISQLARAPLELDKVLTRILDSLQNVVPYTSASLALLEEDSIRLVAGKNLPESLSGRRIYIAENPLLQRIIQQPTPIILKDAQANPYFEQIESSIPPIRSWMCLPLITEDKLVGFLFCDHDAENIFTNEHTRLSLPFAQQAALALEKARLYEQTRHAARRFETLHQVSQDILTLQDEPMALYRAIHQAAARLMPCDAFTIALQTENDEAIHAVYLAKGDQITPPQTITQKTGLACYVLAHRQSLIIKDLDKHPASQNAHRFGSDRPTRSAVTTPIRLGNQFLGVMSAQSYRADAYTEDDLRLLETLATHVAIALENRRLFADLQDRLHEAGIIRQVHETLLAHLEPATLHQHIINILVENIPAAEKGSILLLEEDGSLRVDTSLGYTQNISGITFPPGKGYAQQCIREQRGKVIYNAQESPWFHRTAEMPAEVGQIQSALVVPLITQGKVVGALSLDNTTAPRAFRQEDLQLLETLASSIALSIDNTRLFAALNSRLEELAAINRLLERLQQYLSPKKLVALFFETAAALMPLRAGFYLQQEGDRWQELQRLGEAEDLFIPDLPPATTEPPPRLLDLPHPAGHALLLDLRSSPRQAVLLISPHPFQESQRSLLRTLHDLLANALQQIRLHWRTREQVALLSSMRDINTTLLGSLDFKMVFELVLTHISTYLQPEQVQIWQANNTLQELQLVAWQGIGRPLRGQLRYGEGFAGQLALQRKNLGQITTPADSRPLPDLDGLPVELRWHLGLPLVAKGHLKGVLTLHYARPRQLTFEQEDYLRTLAGQAALAIDNTETWHKSQRSNIELFQAYESMLKAWSMLLEMRQLEPPGHIDRVLPIGLKLARRAGLRGDALLHFKWGVWLHNVGKLALPDDLLHKPGPLTEAERALMEEHPNYAQRILKGLAFVKNAINIPYAHHERWDGTGYPRKLRGDCIPLEARIFAIADVWDILQSPRPYGPAWTREQALEYLRAERGRQFDPDLVDLFLELLEKGEI